MSMKVVMGDYLIEGGWDASERKDKYGDWPASTVFSKPALGGYSAQAALEMEHMKDTYLVYDLEALKAIPKKGETIIPGVEYCNGRTDYAGIGISVLVAWMSQTGRYNIYQKDNLREFEAALKEVDYVIGFNHIKFDNQVVEAAGLTFPETVKHYDISRELWIADGLDPDKFSPSTHGGYSLDACTSVNFKVGKTMDGYMAPIEYQQGNVSKVINYCIADVDLTRRLFEKILNDGYLWHPKYPGKTVTLRKPFETGEFVI